MQMNIPKDLQSSLPNGLNLSFLPPHIVERALALAKPVEASDEPLLVQVIADALQKDKGASYKTILEGLHGTNSHSASLWKDYYLENKQHIDSLVKAKRKEEPAKVTLSKPSGIKKEKAADAEPSTFKKPPNPIPAIKKPSTSDLQRESPKPAPKRAGSKVKTERCLTPITAVPASGSRRATLNSLTTFDPVFSSQLPAPHAEIKIPDLPTREPTPPTTVVPSGLGNKFTEEDRDYFIKFIMMRLKEYPDYTRKQLCDMLAEKVPYHPSTSWTSYWSTHHDLPDKIMTAAVNRLWPFGPNKGGEPQSASTDGTRTSVLKRPNYRESSSSEGESDESDEEEEYVSNRVHPSSKFNERQDQDDDSDDDEPVQEYSESEMSQPRTLFNEADMYITAKHMAEFPMSRWEYASFGERWTSFAEKYTARSDKSWAEYYRRQEKSLRRLAKRIVKEQHSQRVRPSGGRPRKKMREGAESPSP